MPRARDSRTWLVPVAAPIVGGAVLVLGAAAVGGALPALSGTGAPDKVVNGTVTILATIISFLGVATLSVAVSTSLVQTGLDRYHDADLVRPLIDDQGRNRLLALILLGFIVALGNLLLVSFGALDPVAALPLPVGLAALTLTALTAYVIDRMSLFDPSRYARRQLERLDRQVTRPRPWARGRGLSDGEIADLEGAILRVGRLVGTALDEEQTSDAVSITEELVSACLDAVDAQVTRAGLPGPATGGGDPEDEPAASSAGARPRPSIEQAREAKRSAWLVRAVARALWTAREKAIRKHDDAYLDVWYRELTRWTDGLARAGQDDAVAAFLRESRIVFVPIGRLRCPDGEWVPGVAWIAGVATASRARNGGMDRQVASLLNDYLDRYLLALELHAAKRKDERPYVKKGLNWVTRVAGAYADGLEGPAKAGAEARVRASEQRLGSILGPSAP